MFGSMRSGLTSVCDLVEQFRVRKTIYREVKTGDVAAETALGHALPLYQWLPIDRESARTSHRARQLKRPTAVRSIWFHRVVHGAQGHLIHEG
jgi:hypothetical protein